MNEIGEFVGAFFKGCMVLCAALFGGLTILSAVFLMGDMFLLSIGLFFVFALLASIRLPGF